MCFDRKLSNSSDFYYPQPGLHPSITDNVETINTLIEEIHNRSKSRIRIKVSRKPQKVEIYLANEESGLIFFNIDLRHVFGSNAGKEFGMMLRRKGPHKLDFA